MSIYLEFCSQQIFQISFKLSSILSLTTFRKIILIIFSNVEQFSCSQHSAFVEEGHWINLYLTGLVILVYSTNLKWYFPRSNKQASQQKSDLNWPNQNSQQSFFGSWHTFDSQLLWTYQIFLLVFVMVTFQSNEIKRKVRQDPKV